MPYGYVAYANTFNRTIIELKLILAAALLVGFTPFNRTIIELKLLL